MNAYKGGFMKQIKELKQALKDQMGYVDGI